MLVLQLLGLVDVVPGHVTVLDGDSLREGQTEIRLYGIDAPEYRQSCFDSSHVSYACGKRAADELRQLVRGAEVTCKRLDVDRYGRSVAVCKTGKSEINRAMVESGWAVAFVQYGFDYVAVEAAARKEKRGLWAGEFETPATYRHRQHAAEGNATGRLTPDD